MRLALVAEPPGCCLHAVKEMNGRTGLLDQAGARRSARRQRGARGAVTVTAHWVKSAHRGQQPPRGLRLLSANSRRFTIRAITPYFVCVVYIIVLAFNSASDRTHRSPVAGGSSMRGCGSSARQARGCTVPCGPQVRRDE